MEDCVMVRNVRHHMEPMLDPSPAEIRRETAVIRRGWSPSERYRRCRFKPVPWTPPVFSTAELDISEWDQSSPY